MLPTTSTSAAASPASTASPAPRASSALPPPPAHWIPPSLAASPPPPRSTASSSSPAGACSPAAPQRYPPSEQRHPRLRLHLRRRQQRRRPRRPPAGGDFLVGTTVACSASPPPARSSPPSPPPAPPRSAVRAILPLSGDRFVIAGRFTTYNGVTANRIAVINADGTASTSIDFGTGFNDTVNTLALDSQNRLWAGGTFTTYRGLTTTRLAVIATTNFTPDTPAPPSSDLLDDFLVTAGVPANLRGPNDDADNDGLDNLLEYALDLNPNGTGGAFTGTPPTSVQTPTD